MKKQRWKRVDTTSGPANLLDGRWKIQHQDREWWTVYDRVAKLPVFEPGKFGRKLGAKTMRELKVKLQQLVDTGVLK